MSGRQTVVTATIAVLAMIVIAAARNSLGERIPGQNTGGPASAVVRSDEEIVAAERSFRAMISVQFHAASDGRAVPPDVDRTKLDVMPLGDAIDVLIEDSIENPLGRSRRRRAIAMLAGYVDHADTESAGGWRKLISRESTFDAIAARLLTESASHPEKRARIAYEMLGELPVNRKPNDDRALLLSIPGCGPKWMQPDGFNLKAATATVGIWASVTRSTDEVRKRLDPQEWDRFNRFFFPPERTYLTPEPRPTSVVPCAEFDSITPPMAATGVPAGAFFDKRYFYEDASCPGCKRFRFKTILQVQARPSSNPCAKTPSDWCNCPGCRIEYQACYELHAPLSACVDGQTPILTADEGHLSACRITHDATEVRTRKEISLSEPSASITAFFGFYLGQKEMEESLTEQLCCNEPECWK